MDFDIVRYLTEDMGFPAEQAAEIAKGFTPERTEKVKAQYVSPADRNKYRDVEKAQAALADAEQKLNREIGEWSQLTAAEKAANDQMRIDLDAARLRQYETEQKLIRTAEQAGLDPKTLVGEATPPPKKEVPVAPVLDPKTFVNREQFAGIMDYTLELPATLQYIADQHRELTGQSLDTRTIVAEIRERSKKGGDVNPVAVWEEKFDIPAKRQAKADETRKTEMKAAEDRGYERARSEAAIPSPSMPGRSAPVFTMKNAEGQPRTSRLSRPAPESTVTAAAQALRSGKYRQAAGR